MSAAATPTADMSASGNGWPRVLFYTSALLWLLALIAFTVQAPLLFVTIAGGSALFAAAPLALTLRFESLLLLPLFSLTGPVMRVGAGGIGLHAGDAYLLLVSAAMLVGYGFRGRFQLGRDALTFLLLLSLVLLSAAFSRYVAYAFVAVVGIAQVALLYLITINRVRTPAEGVHVVAAWVGAVTMSSVLVIAFLLMRRPLLLGMDTADFAYTAAAYGFLRGTFFYTGFIFPLVISIVTLVYQLLHPSVVRARTALVVSALAINLTALAVLANKTAILAAFIGIVVVLLSHQLSSSRVMTWRRMAAMVCVLGLIGFVGWLRMQFVTAGNAPLSVMADYFANLNSFRARLAMWYNVLEYMLHSPRDLLLGVGPDVSVRNARLPIFRAMFVSTFGSEGAADSTYVYLLLNFGLLFCLVLGWSLLKLVVRLYRNPSPEGRDLTVLICVALLMWAIMGITQQTGVSKPVFLFVQLTALAQVLSLRTESTPGGGRQKWK